MEKVEYLIIHDSDSAFGNVFTIDDWHRQRGFKWVHPRSGTIIYVGYHYIILNGSLFSSNEFESQYDGLVVPCRPDDVKGAHCVAQGMNSISIGICLVGNGKFSKNQISSLSWLLKRLMNDHGIDPDKVLGHKEVDATKRDPRLNMNVLRQWLKKNKK